VALGVIQNGAGAHGLSEVVYASARTLRSHGPAFALLTLSYFPALSLGPLADDVHQAFG
jgi:K+-transporting ATPase A subunit